MHWKIKRDPFYREVYNDTWKKKTAEELVEEAGFFIDSATSDFSLETSLETLCTPLSFMTNSASSTENPIVLLTTGSFCPLHDGHIQMMEKAKERCIQAGYDVLGGYFAPDHDEYVLGKVKDKGMRIHQRIEAIHEKIKHINWLKIDTWPGLFHERALNFTDVYLRLEMYLQKYVNPKIQVFFVCGGDNARFVLTFRKYGNCVVVNRPGYNMERYTELFDNKRLLYVYNNNVMSSTEVRKTLTIEEKQKRLMLRIDKADGREDKVLKLLEENFEEIIVNRVNEQQKLLKNIEMSNVISLDSLTETGHSLKISRQYDVFGINMLGFTHRPGSETIEKQIKNIPKRDYFIFDDDMHTGRTMQFATELLEKENIKVAGHAFFSISGNKEEILDMRDFFFGEENSGLVILCPDLVTRRFPYVYPYVCPYIRGSINDPLKFSAEIWKINMDHFRRKDTQKYLICKKHYEQLISLLDFS